MIDALYSVENGRRHGYVTSRHAEREPRAAGRPPFWMGHTKARVHA
jgi:hypothetical protein